MSIIREVKLSDIPDILTQVSEALKPLNIKVLSDYEASIFQRGEMATARGARIGLVFYKEDE